jgi:Cof subfamily protein (haloacid dehalogenase superfamily)
MNQIRLIALDLDGTLLDDRKQVPADNVAALKEADRQGVLICLASGRMVSTIEAVENRIGVDCIVIAYNGGKVVGRRSEGRPLLGHHPLSVEVADAVIKFAEEHHHPLNFYDRDLLYAEDSPLYADLIELYARRTGSKYNLVKSLRESFAGVPPTKLILLAFPPERDRLYELLSRELAQRAIVSRTEPEYLEIMAPDADKGNALSLIARRYGVELGDIMAIGDAENDTGMMRLAGAGVAVANAPSYVRASANLVTEHSNNDAAVAEAIRRWVLPQLSSPSKSGTDAAQGSKRLPF